MGGGLDPKHGHWVGTWGDANYFPQKGIASYTLSPNRQRLFPNFWHTAIFNTFRRFRHQVLYVVPPFVVAYSLMDWAIERNEYLNSKAGRAEATD
ncbi:putative ubiquinol-cytochrome c reductase complex ubiquinone-binding protein QP-C precursor [Talaromyces proteolyticus]|uniref:Cytochrome b-c1 complex subunit 8 n=1 Tax=Talaromyces proteolyticus TaxID=1131652 RepID=A0AAD4PU80_9EURO|nr:putative ubiquinol-cytochrome c reductase complex ubiquinone-binding protein QP-C precursor [Talaromyces proteolyticus]KAH8694283.1 putative ubiquinol-cytochrome c reductase complex ubiquinone-binding protein QP-C precursor [Talaromyces proteolyticus]